MLKVTFITGIALKSLLCPVLDGLAEVQALLGITGQEVYINHVDHGHVLYR